MTAIIVALACPRHRCSISGTEGRAEPGDGRA